jgi:Tfp pilus assembly protein PilF
MGSVMLGSAIRIAALLCVVLAPPVFATAAHGTTRIARVSASELGEVVVLRTPAARLEQDGQTFAPHGLHRIFTVVGEEGTSFLVRSFGSARLPGDLPTEEGWIRAECVVGLREAIAYFTGAIRDDDTAWNRCTRGMVLQEQNRFDEAIGDYDASINRGDDVWALACRGQLLWRQKGDLKRAVVDFSRAIQQSPRLRIPYRWRGEVYSSLMEYQSAELDFSRYITLDPGNARVLDQLGLCRHALGKWAQAAANYRAAAEIADLDDAYSAPHRHLAWLKATCPDGNVREAQFALSEARRVVELERRESPLSLAVLAAAHAEAGEFRQAVELQSKALASYEVLGQSNKGQKPTGLMRKVLERHKAERERTMEKLRSRLRLYEQGQPLRTREAEPY